MNCALLVQAGLKLILLISAYKCESLIPISLSLSLSLSLLAVLGFELQALPFLLVRCCTA
jgi:hypothetical protein